MILQHFMYAVDKSIVMCGLKCFSHTYICLCKKSSFMIVKLHLHSNLPYPAETPNAALGYLKSALSPEKVDVTNVYWYLPPREILEFIDSIPARFNRRIGLFSPSTALAAYFSRFIFKNEDQPSPTITESLMGSYITQEKVRRTAQAFKDFIDSSIETENMADVDIAGFTVNFYQWILSRYVWSTLKRMNPNIKIVVGGLATRGDAEAFLNTFEHVDYAVYGEGEIPLRILVNRLNDRQALSNVPRLAYRDKDTLCFTEIPGESRLEPSPFADYTEYFDRIRKFNLNISPIIPILGTRSCRWNKCKFCRVNEGATYYEKPIRDVIREIEYHSRIHDVNSFFFVDTDFGRRSKKDCETLLSELLKSVDERKKPYEMWATLSPTLLSRKFVHMMSKIKINVQVGFEALTDHLLENMNKMHRFAENIQALKFGKDYKLEIHGLNVIRNLPGESESDVIESIENLTYLRFLLQQYNLRPSELTLYKGTEYYREIPEDEREKEWVVNVLYDEIERMNFLGKDKRWDFFGFRAKKLNHYFLWDQFTCVLEDFQKAEISYSWVEFSDGSSFITEYNNLNGNKKYHLTILETKILKLCDCIKTVQELKNELNPICEGVIEDAVSQLRRVNFLYVGRRERLISIVSVKDMKNTDEGD